MCRQGFPCPAHFPREICANGPPQRQSPQRQPPRCAMTPRAAVLSFDLPVGMDRGLEIAVVYCRRPLRPFLQHLVPGVGRELPDGPLAVAAVADAEGRPHLAPRRQVPRPISLAVGLVLPNLLWFIRTPPALRFLAGAAGYKAAAAHDAFRGQCGVKPPLPQARAIISRSERQATIRRLSWKNPFFLSRL